MTFSWRHANVGDHFRDAPKMVLSRLQIVSDSKNKRGSLMLPLIVPTLFTTILPDLHRRPRMIFFSTVHYGFAESNGL